jgi:hypothetical protein
MKSQLQLVIVIITLLNAVVPFNRNTGWNDYGGGHIHYLDRHDVSCNYGEILTEFQLVKDGDKMKYEYTCVDINLNGRTDSYTRSTSLNDIDNNPFASVHYLDRHGVQCDEGSVLQRFKYIRGNDNKIKYEYTCIKVRSYCQTRYTEKSIMGSKSTFDLTKQKVTGGFADAAIRGFRLKVEYNIVTDDHNIIVTSGGYKRTERADHLSYTLEYCSWTLN